MDKFLVILMLAAFTTVGCSQKTASIAATPEPTAVERVIVTGLGTLPIDQTSSPAQKQLMAIRAAKLDAYRNAVEQLYGIDIDSQTTVKNMALEKDFFQASVEGKLRGARFISVLPVEEGIYEAQLEINVAIVEQFCPVCPSQQPRPSSGCSTSIDCDELKFPVTTEFRY